ncbi:peptidoglycan-binding domain-containing protein [Streptomyces chilikensis]|uniref:peptidoglycan-binding domain-containing protein n=1 Tax=Streptomyces chilikensis TaxID=1194079 RepID=UPI000AE3A8AC|nr:peptidoglycan-binding protein [Streptomyces chilikensis]
MNPIFGISRGCITTVAAALTVLGTAITGEVAVAAESDASAVYPCRITKTANGYTAGYYSGNTVIPSSTQVTAAGKEAQCLLDYMGPDPGTIDGIFGPQSKDAAANFQKMMNSACNAGLVADGIVGSKTWPYLRKGCH